MTISTATALINRQALVDNLVQVKSLTPNSNTLAVLKANGYGHGLTLIAQVLSDNKTAQPDAFGVARLDEALQLRAAGIDKPIVLLEGFFAESDLTLLSTHQLQTVVHSKEQLLSLMQADLAKPLKVWLKIDTGMRRLGIEPDEFPEFYHALTSSKNVDNDIVLMSHLACADDVQDNKTVEQLAVFNALTDSSTQARSVANSAAVCAWPNSHYQWVRPGIMLYGVSPLLNKPAKTLGLSPVMTLKSSIIATRKLSIGDSVGYGGTWISDKNTTIGVIAVGYGDGYPRHAKSGTPVLINGRIVPLVGRVSMDMITVDLGENSTDAVGDIATLWGDSLPVEEVANYADTIAYELLCNITSRVKIKLL